MKKLSKLEIHCAAALFLGSVIAAPQGLVAQTHVVPQSQIQKDMATSSATRQQNEQRLKDLLTTPGMQQTLESRGINPTQVTNAISQLNNRDLAQLASRSAQAQKDFAAGDINNHEMLLILVGVIVLILIIVAIR